MQFDNPFIPQQITKLFASSLQKTARHYQEMILALEGKRRPKRRRMKHQVQIALAAIKEELKQREGSSSTNT